MLNISRIGVGAALVVLTLFTFPNNGHAQSAYRKEGMPYGARISPNGTAVPPGVSGGYSQPSYGGGYGGGSCGGGNYGGGYGGGSYGGGYPPPAASACVTQFGLCPTNTYVGAPCGCSDGVNSYAGIAQ